MDEPHATNAQVAQLASELQRRLSQLTSTWTAAPVEVHRLQETVVRVSTILQSSVQRQSEPALELEAVVGSTRHQVTANERLGKNLLLMSRLLEEVNEILEFVLSNDARKISSELHVRWRRRQREAAALRVRLSAIVQQVLVDLSMMNVVVSTIDPAPSESPSKLEEAAIDAEFALKFRHMDFVDVVSRGDVVSEEAETSLRHTEKYIFNSSEEEPKTRRPFDDQKLLAMSPLESKSPSSLRTRRVNSQNTIHTPTGRQEGNEREFRHLEQVFHAISPFGLQEAKWIARDHGPTLVRESFPKHEYHARQRGSSTRAELIAGRPIFPPASLSVAPRPSRFRQGCHPSCPCICHAKTHLNRGVLSAFKSTFGSFTFIFSTHSSNIHCNTPSCLSRRSQYLQISYAFPVWLFHAAISATFKNWSIGSPEFLLRVHRRIGADMMSTSTSVFGSITRGDVDNLKRALVRREASVYDVAGVAGVSLLYHALRLRQIDMVELLLCEGADLFQLDDAGLGPYHEAIQVLYTSASVPFHERLQNMLPMDQILEAGQLTPLHKIAMGILWVSVGDYVAAHGDADINAGDSNGQTPLFYACARGDITVVQALLEVGASPDAPTAVLSASSVPLSWTPLSMAARNGNLAVVTQLLAAGASVHVRTKHNRTVLHECAPTRGDRVASPDKQTDRIFVEIAGQLLSHGADLHVVDNYGSTALDAVCIRDHVAVARFLIESGIDTCHRDWEGSNALANCIIFHSYGCANLLLGLGAERSGIQNVDENGSTTLHYMATGGSVQMMELFIHGPKEVKGLLELDARDNQGLTALEVFETQRVGGATEEMAQMFLRFLQTMSKPGSKNDIEWDIQSEEEATLEFFDAEESFSE